MTNPQQNNQSNNQSNTQSNPIIAAATSGPTTNNIWPSPENPRLCAPLVIRIAQSEGKPLLYWRGEWYRWCGTHYKKLSEDDLDDWLYELLENAQYQGAQAVLNWNPKDSKLKNLRSAMRGLVKLDSTVEDGSWLNNRKTKVIPCLNGLIQASNLKRIDHTPDYFCTELKQFEYDPEAKLDVGEKFLKMLTGDDQESIDALLEFVGCRLVEDQHFQKAFLIRGPTGSGKGAFNRWIKKIFGGRHIDMHASDYAKNAFPTEPLLGKSLVTFSDERIVFNAKAFVDLIMGVTGEDEMSVRLPYERKSIAYRLPLSFLFLSNVIPYWPDNAGAMQRRIIAIESPESFEGREDLELENDLAKEIPALVNAALAAYRRLSKRGHFIQPESGRAVLSLLRLNSSHLMEFVEECCDLGDYEQEKHPVFRRYSGWCDERGYKPSAENKFAGELYSLNFPGEQRITAARVSKPRDDGSRPYVFFGLRLRVGASALRVVAGS